MKNLQREQNEYALVKCKETLENILNPFFRTCEEDDNIDYQDLQKMEWDLEDALKAVRELKQNVRKVS